MGSWPGNEELKVEYIVSGEFVDTPVDVTGLHPFTASHLAAALACGANFLNANGDRAKDQKSGADARAGYDFFPASFASCGAWCPSTKKWFQELWSKKFKEAKAANEPICNIAQRMLHWRARVSACVQRANAHMLLSRAWHQRAACPGHTACARASCLPESTVVTDSHTAVLSPPRVVFCVLPK